MGAPGRRCSRRCSRCSLLLLMGAFEGAQASSKVLITYPYFIEDAHDQRVHTRAREVSTFGRRQRPADTMSVAARLRCHRGSWPGFYKPSRGG